MRTRMRIESERSSDVIGARKLKWILVRVEVLTSRTFYTILPGWVRLIVQ